MKPLVAGLVAALAVSCSNPPMPIRLHGDPVSIAWLAGSWTGEYWGGASGRQGTINFDLASGTDSLYGDVMMVDPMGNVLRAADPTDHHQLHVRSFRHLRIDLVRATADTVRGVLEPYIAPECNCVVTTAFVGVVRGDTMTGTFVTRGGAAVRQEGLWRMHRLGTTRP